MESNLPIFLISGAPGSGKTSVATALMQSFPLGLHLPVDDLREWVVSGIAHPVPTWTEETERQFCLARQGAAQVARLYAEAGFAVAVADVLDPFSAYRFFIEALPDCVLHPVLLWPRLEVALERNALRTNKGFDTEALHEPIRRIYQHFSGLRFVEEGWTVLDNSDISVEETVTAILERTGTRAG